MSAMQGALSAAERSMRSVFVGNIPYEATEEQLKDIFAEVGPVVSFRLVYDRETGKPKGYGFCEYKDQEMALSAMRNLNSYELNGRALRVDNAASEKSKEELKNLQASLGGPPVESPYGPEVAPEKAPDTIAKVMCSVPPEQLYELMIQMKTCVENNPNEARNLLIQNPQLAYALLQAQVIMKVIDAETAKNMLHAPGFQSAPSGALLPTPEKKAMPPLIPPGGMDNPTSYPSAMPPNQLNSLPQNPAMQNPRPTQPVMPLTRPALLGERPPLLPERPSLAPGHPNPVLQNPFPDRDSRTLGDHDLRQMPMSDRDMRPPPLLVGDKDMRQPVGDQDLRTLNPPGPDNRAFDPRFRNMPGPDVPPMTGPPVRPGQPGDMPSFDRPRAGPSYDPRGVPPASVARVEPVSQSTGNRVPPQNPRVAAVGGNSPAVGAASPSAGASPCPPNNSLAAAAAAIAPHDQEKAALIMQVLQLSDQQIAMLPPEQRQSIMILKEQIARSQNLP
ncbi:cleavage stimulation factor subunit 2-like isoform X2 [Argiope bruennichi]|uniref:cleavage stimulation factor subunit 2-like isoform X2 n=1 Tax=Argiope bruennichi TaxID=94029 RepID=UPI0024945B78|nr:cleavage stimulation factor subunit 2-like isoform X2 [Argiope bruennichi]